MEASGRIVDSWIAKLEIAQRVKQDEFQDTADQVMRFYRGPHDFALGESGVVAGGPGFSVPHSLRGQLPYRMTVNKIAEFVQIYLPYLYHRNPNRTVTPRKVDFHPGLLAALGRPPRDPFFDAVDHGRALLMSHYLNYTPHELGLREECRLGIQEALLKGRGIVLTKLFAGPSGNNLVGSEWKSVDKLLIDPDCCRHRDAGWIAIEGCMPAWKLERMWERPTGSIKGNRESLNSRSQEDVPAEGTCDLVRYHEIYSRMGIGGRFNGISEELRAALEQFGDNVYLVIAQGNDFPLNMPPEVLRTATRSEIRERLSWPTPFFADHTHPWPFAELDFHFDPGKLWPKSHVGFALGEQIFLDWAYSFLANKVSQTGRTLLALKDTVSDEMRDRIQNGGDLEILELQSRSPETIKDILQFLEFPPMNRDLLEVLAMVDRNIEKRLGTPEVMYGQSSRSDRSATESQSKDAKAMHRPEYMAECVESWASLIARKEGIAARYHLGGGDVAPIFGEPLDEAAGYVGPLTQLWSDIVSQPDMGINVAELEYRIEAGSTRKPNREREAQNIDESAQVLLPHLIGVWQTTGDPASANEWLRQWAKTRDMDASPFMLPDMRMQMQQQPPAPSRTPVGTPRR